MTDQPGATPAETEPAATTGEENTEDAEAQELLAEAAAEDGAKPDDEPLGDAGKRALERERERVKSERQRRRDLEAELQKLRGEAAKKPDDEQPSADEIRREAEQAATEKANARIVRSEIRAAAAGKLADPKDALTFLDADQFEVDENGEVDSDEVADAIDDLLRRKPYLAAATARRFQGTADGGAAREAGKPKQLSESDVKSMTPEQIVEAKREGRLNDYLGINS